MKTATATVTSKGQVTIPKDVRDAMHIADGDQVRFTVRDDGVVELHRARARNPNPRPSAGMLAEYGRPGVTIEDYREAAIQHAVERQKPR